MRRLIDAALARRIAVVAAVDRAAERGGFPAALTASSPRATSRPRRRRPAHARRAGPGRADDRAAGALGDGLGRVVRGGAHQRPARAGARSAGPLRKPAQRRPPPRSSSSRAPTAASTPARAWPASAPRASAAAPRPRRRNAWRGIDVRRACCWRRGRTFSFAALLLGPAAPSPRPARRQHRGRLRLPFPRRHPRRIGTDCARRVQLRRRQRLLRRRFGDEHRARARRPLRADARLRRLRGTRGRRQARRVGARVPPLQRRHGRRLRRGLRRRPGRRLGGARPLRARLLRPRRLDGLCRARRACTLLDEHFRLFGHIGAIVRVAGDGARREPRPRRPALGVGWVMRGLDLQLAWIAASRGGPYPAVYDRPRSAWVASASYSF